MSFCHTQPFSLFIKGNGVLSKEADFIKLGHNYANHINKNND